MTVYYSKECNIFSTQCNDGYYAQGSCDCDEGFSGDDCSECPDNKKFGVNCTQGLALNSYPIY